MQTNVRPMVVSGAESANRPPVPPRRKKRKAKFPPTVKSPQGTSPTSRNKPDRKRLPPPPPPPRAARRVKCHAAKDHREETISTNEETEDSLNSLSLNETEAPQPSSLQFSTDRNDNYDTVDAADSSNERSFPLYETLTRKETNQYPPLLFTLQDFQNVMSSTLQHEEESRIRSFRESFEHSLDDEENDLCFRVTTTNLPFEKCLDRWNAMFDKFDDSSRFIFDDYIDRSNKVNVRRSTGPMSGESLDEEPMVPRSTKVRFVIESPSSSTPDYELDEDGEATCDSLQNIDSLVDEEAGHARASVQSTEVTAETDEGETGHEQGFRNDQFGDVPFGSVLTNRNSIVEWPSLKSVLSSIVPVNRGSNGDSFRGSTSLESQNESFESALEIDKLETVNEAENLGEPEAECVSVSNEDDGSIEKENLARSTSVDCIVHEATRVAEIENNNIEEITLQSTEEVVNDVEQDLKVNVVNEQETAIGGFEVNETNETEDCVAEEDLISDKVSYEANEKVSSVEESNKKQSTETDLPKKSSQEYKRKLFVAESFRNINHDSSSNDPEEERASEENDGAPVSSIKDEDVSFLRNNSVSVPVNIRRNSFLENMLSEDSNEVWNVSTSCKIVGACPKLSLTREDSVSATKDEGKLANRLNVSIKMDTEIQKILQESDEISKKVDNAIPKLRKSPVIVKPTKNAGEAKCNVLNELLSNFGKIKLKPVNGGRQTDIENLALAIDEEKIETMTDSCVETSSNNGDKSPTDDRNMYPKEVSSNREELTFDKSSEEFLKEKDYLKNYEIKSNGNGEVVKVDVHRSLNEDYPKSSRSVLELRVEPDKSEKGDASLEESHVAVESSAEPLQIVVCSEKTDAKVCEDELDDRGEKYEPPNRGRQLDLRRSSGEKSAIARRIPRPHCNNNDNNRAVTPVAVSDDQSHDAVTITPGRVRSFVKYYEIRGEATNDKDSKTNDKVDTNKMTGHQSVFSIRRGLEARAIEARSFDARRDNFQISLAERSTERLVGPRKEAKRSGIMEKVGIEVSSRSDDSGAKIPEEDSEEEKTLQKSHGDSSTRPGKVKRKKSVKFQGGYTVIGAKSLNEDGSVGSATNQDPKSMGKRKAPGRPETKETILDEKVDSDAIEPEGLDADSCSFQKREIAAQIHAAADREDCSGINRFVTKPETPRLVFYCTV
ncbi:uncharacterized protein LOC122397628 isoform X1 [Colletes gigas]|uniref:uncharacterized protein LOC122397628 isoform X1 n=1 Tax=Colletes gigas TaxID=935657 RepID=UPI001C9B5B33|nr:uncharacterized protein LOC122397628 isoform X1 [Colletes gigas]